MTDCYISTRVYASKQVKEGHGLGSQVRRCPNYAKFNDFNVIIKYVEKRVSRWTICRPKLEMLFLYLKQNKIMNFLLIL